MFVRSLPHPCPAPVQAGLGLCPVVLDFSGLDKVAVTVGRCRFITWLIVSRVLLSREQNFMPEAALWANRTNAQNRTNGRSGWDEEL